MLSLVLLLLFQQDDLRELDALARSRDVKGLAAHASPALVKSGAFNFLKQDGPYGTGNFGWHAYRLTDPVGGGTHIVFGTRVTTEDYGEFVFTYKDGKLQSLVDERDARGYTVEHYDFDLRFVPSERRANINCAVRINRTPTAEQCAHFRLSPNYKVSRVTDSKGENVQFAQASGVVSVFVKDTGSSTLSMSYSGIVDQPQYAGSITDNEVMLTNDYWWPMIARGPATFTTTTHVPKAWTVVAQGKKTGETLTGDERTVKYQMDLPVSYLSFSAGPFLHVEKKVGRINYHVWSKDMDQGEMRLQLELMPPVVEFYERFAPYPFEDFGAMVTSSYGGGALEAYSYATYGTGWLPDEDAHEPAHTWWGGLVANTYLNSFWNEGFAVFSEGLYAREVGIGNREERREAFVQQFGVEPSAYEVACGKAGAFAGPVASYLGYGKSAAVLQQLECEIGTDAMVASMARWLEDNPKGRPGEWAGFEAAVTKTVGSDMRWFFRQWIDRPGAPNFEIKDVEWLNGFVQGVVEFKGDPYRLTLDVYAEFASGKKLNSKVVVNSQAKKGSTEFSLSLPERPTLVSFDPFERIFRERASPPPTRLTLSISEMKAIVDEKRKEYAVTFERLYEGIQIGGAVPSDLNGKFLIGHPDTMPAMKPLCAKVGFVVTGNTLTYKGTKIDLTKGASLAIVDLGGGKKCAIGLGKSVRSPSVGNSRLCLVDNYGRFLRGVTEPQREGALVFRKP